MSERRAPPGPTSTGAAALAIALPRPWSRTDAVLAPPGEDLPVGAATDVRDRLRRDLGALAAELPPGAHLRIDVARVILATRHPDRCASFDVHPFEPTARACRRAIGSAAVNRCVRGLAGTPVAAVDDVLAAGVEDVARAEHDGPRPSWWAGWYAQLALGGRAAVMAEAVTWATQVLTALDWSRFDRPPVIGGRDDWWQSTGGTLTLQGRVEVRAQLDGRCALVAMPSGSCGVDWRVRLGFSAVVCLLARGERALPCRIVGIWPASGQLRVLPVDVAALDEVATAVVSATATWVDATIHRASPTAGPIA